MRSLAIHSASAAAPPVVGSCRHSVPPCTGVGNTNDAAPKLGASVRPTRSSGPRGIRFARERVSAIACPFAGSSYPNSQRLAGNSGVECSCVRASGRTATVQRSSFSEHLRASLGGEGVVSEDAVGLEAGSAAFPKG